MIIIYDMENTYFSKSSDEAKLLLLELYGNKLGEEAYAFLKKAPVGSSYRRHGGPLVKIVGEEEWLKALELEKERNL